MTPRQLARRLNVGVVGALRGIVGTDLLPLEVGHDDELTPAQVAAIEWDVTVDAPVRRAAQQAREVADAGRYAPVRSSRFD